MQKLLNSRAAGAAGVVTSSAVLVALFVSGSAQAITDNAFNYSTPKTGYLNIPATGFSSLQSSPEFYFQSHHLRQSANTSTGACYAAAVNLPQGAILTAITVWYGNGGGNAFVDPPGSGSKNAEGGPIHGSFAGQDV